MDQMAPYYIKGQDFNNVVVSQQACWMVRKILCARACLEQMQIKDAGKWNLIRQIYIQLLGNCPRVAWKCLIFKNDARPKAKFTMWLQLQGRLLTTDRLAKWGLNVDLRCALCQSHDESRDHLFVEFEFTRFLWAKMIQWLQKQIHVGATWEQHLDRAIRNAKGRSLTAQIFRMVYVECIHGSMPYGWKETRGFLRRKVEVGNA